MHPLWVRNSNKLAKNIKKRNYKRISRTHQTWNPFNSSQHHTFTLSQIKKVKCAAAHVRHHTEYPTKSHTFKTYKHRALNYATYAITHRIPQHQMRLVRITEISEQTNKTPKNNTTNLRIFITVSHFIQTLSSCTIYLLKYVFNVVKLRKPKKTMYKLFIIRSTNLLPRSYLHAPHAIVSICAARAAFETCKIIIPQSIRSYNCSIKPTVQYCK